MALQPGTKPMFHDGLEASPARLEPCEPRLALSASMTGELLLDALGVTTPDSFSIEIQSQTPQSALGDTIAAGVHDDVAPNLISQAADLRATQSLAGAGQTVAVIDSGVAWDHVALGGGFGPGYRVVGGWDFAENDANPYDDGPAGFHGTHIAGLLAGSTRDFTGVAPGADIVALRVFDDAGSGQLKWIESALQWVHANKDAFDSPITTVNLSIGAALSDANRSVAMAMLEDELAILRQDNILVFAASGNFFDGGAGNDGVLYPASSSYVIPVASIDDGGELSSFAQREAGIFATPGRSIVSSVPDHVFGWDGKVDDFASLDGTSMATPQVAGASMLVRQAMFDEGLTPTGDDVLARMRETSIERIDPITGISYRTLDLRAAIGKTNAAETVHPMDRFTGSSDNEQVELDLRNGIHLRVGGVSYSLASPTDNGPIVIDVGGGVDDLLVRGSGAAERLILHADSAQASSLSTNSFNIELRGFEHVSFDGGGGSDRASLFDSIGSDTLQSQPGLATLRGTGFQFDVIGVPRVYVHATGGGNDIAFLQDSEGDDALSVRPQFTSLQSPDSFQLAYGFERVYAYATAGGFDTAEIFDSEGDDTMSVSSGRSIITGPGYHVSATGFESTTGHANAGGNDIARIYADESNSRWETTADRVQWTGPDGAVRIARGFERNEAFEQFEPIELTTASLVSGSNQWWQDDAKTRAARDADAARQVFAALGAID